MVMDLSGRGEYGFLPFVDPGGLGVEKCDTTRSQQADEEKRSDEGLPTMML